MPVSMITGMEAVAGFSRKVPQISSPFNRGSIKSSTIKSGEHRTGFDERVNPVGGGADGKTGVFQVPADRFKLIRIIFYDQYFSSHKDRFDPYANGNSTRYE